MAHWHVTWVRLRVICFRPARILLLISLLLLLLACSGPALTSPTPAADRELILYNWAGDIPESILNAFKAATGISVKYVTYESTEEAVANLRAGKTYDLVIMENRFIQPLIQAGLLAELDLGNLPNFKNISPNFRDLAFDPGNRHSVPYSWGTTGLIVRTDVITEPVTSWNSLWDPRYRGRIGIWRGQSREVIGMTLRSLGYSANTEDAAALTAARLKLLQLRPNVRFIEEWDLFSSASALTKKDLVLTMGYAYEAMEAQEAGDPVNYVLPAEGALLWGDNYIIPAASRQKRNAERLMDYLLSPKTSAELITSSKFQIANDAALPYLAPALRDDPLLYPPDDQLRNAEIVLPLSPAGERAYSAIWEAFLKAGE